MIVATTQRPAHLHTALASVLDQAKESTWGEKIIEYAGRVCYASEPMMGRAPGFIGDRVREGHYDIVEHAWATYSFPMLLSAEFQLEILNASRHAEIATKDGYTYVSGNLRVWRDLIRANVFSRLAKVLPFIAGVAPVVFADLVNETDDRNYTAPVNYTKPEGIRSTIDLLGYSIVEGLILNGFGEDRHNHATFCINGISRVASHQLVRHRMASFSQSSMRYIDLQKGKWEAVIPPAIQADPQAMRTIERLWEEAEIAYASLRGHGIRKEDARFLLPNAASTKIVVSMNFFYWKHFLWLRALDKAAQWEIRAMGQDILKLLYALQPDSFMKEMDYYTANEEALTKR